MARWSAGVAGDGDLAWPRSPADPVRVQRRVSCRGALAIAGQRIHVGIGHAGQTLTVEAAEHTWRIHDDDGLVAEVARTTTKPIARFKVHKPEPPRRRTGNRQHP